jgi:adenosine deaminase
MLINLHSHLEGRVRATTAAELAPLAGLPTPAPGWARALRLAGPGDLTAYLDVVSSTYPFFGRPDWTARVVREAVQDAAADGVDHLELRFGPLTHARAGYGLDDVLAAACAGLAAGRAETGISAGIVVSALRKHSGEANADLARAAVRHAGDGVVGFDLAGNEGRYPDLRPHADAFAVARAGGLGLTAHAAEDGPGTAAAEAVSLFGVSRIGHGTRVAADPEVMRRLAGEGVVLEVCPTSNWYTGAIPAPAAHPAGVFRASGLPVVLGDDNPVQTGSPLSREREVLRGLGFGDVELAELDRVSLRAAFLSETDRARLAAGSGGQSTDCR